MGRTITIKQLIKAVELEVYAGESGINNIISEDEVRFPWLEFAGIFDYYVAEKINLVSSKEMVYLNALGSELAKERVENFFKKQPSGIVFSKNVDIPDYVIELGNKYKVPVLKSMLRTTSIHSRLYGYVCSKLSPRESVHGVLLDINGMGTLIIGKSGIGKSETALELVKRGHQLVADDRVEIYEKEVGVLIGEAPELIAQYIEVRGVGIVNVMHMFGAGAYRESKKVKLVIELELWDKDKNYDRLGLEYEKVKFFNTELPKLVIPVLPGRNNAVLVEAAAMNQKLKYLGLNGAKTLTERISRATRGEDDDL